MNDHPCEPIWLTSPYRLEYRRLRREVTVEVKLTIDDPALYDKICDELNELNELNQGEES